MNKILDYLHLREIGGLELLLAFFPILIAYTIVGLPLGIVLCALVVFILFLKNQKLYLLKKNPLSFFLFFMLLHDFIVLCLLKTAQGVFINSVIGQLAYLVAAIEFGNSVNFKKFRGSINWVTLLCMAGMVYHYLLALKGSTFSPLQLPFLPTQDSTNRMFWEVDRPTSFFMEPQSYVSFMMIPFFLALDEKKILWTATIAITIFMSSSTTGLVEAFLMFILSSILNSGGKKKWLSSIIIIMIGTSLLLLLVKSGLFEQGIKRIEHKSANVEEEIRLVQGPLIVSTMNISDWPLGAPYANAYQYCVDRGLSSQVVVYSENDVYIPTFWMILLRYGIIGLFLYLNMFWYYYKRSKAIRPFVICYFVVLFTNPDALGGNFCFAILFIMSYCNYQIQNKYESCSHRVRIRQPNA